MTNGITEGYFSNYENDNTFKALIGIPPDGVIIFVSSIFSGALSDKELRRKSGMLELWSQVILSWQMEALILKICCFVVFD